MSLHWFNAHMTTFGSIDDDEVVNMNAIVVFALVSLRIESMQLAACERLDYADGLG